MFKDSHEGVITTLSLLSKYSPNIGELWSQFPAMLGLFDHYLGTSSDYYVIDPLVLTICNFVQRDADTFCN